MIVQAPFAGWLLPLTEVPDPVFASGSMGEGFAIDPLENVVRAPCAATVSAVAPTLHSITLDVAGGGTLLIHVGLDTVALKGHGFEVLVEPGQRVAAGDPLIAFDLNKVALGARSLITPVVAIGEGDRLEVADLGRQVARGQTIAELVPGRSRSAVVEDPTANTRVVVPMAHGIHARPAARIVAAAKSCAASIELQLADRRADARSIVQLLALAAKQGDELIINGAGPGAENAVRMLADLIRGGMGDSSEAQPIALPTAGPVIASPGLAIGIAVELGRAIVDVPETGQGTAEERKALHAALTEADWQLSEARGMAAEIAGAHKALLDDPSLRASADARIGAGKSAAFAWRAAVNEACAILEGTGDPLLRERIADLRDVEQQVIVRLTGAKPTLPALPRHAILIADDLLPTEFQALDADRLAGVLLARGGPTAHVAVLAASAGVPMLVAAGPEVLEIADGTPLILDAEAGELIVSPDAAALDSAGSRVAARRDARSAAHAQAVEPAHTRDGIRIQVFANLGSVDDAARAVAAGAEGCGLLRTEFLFLGREQAPTEDEQSAIYRNIAASLGDRPLIVRTFDIGGDKPVAYLPMPAEENPALGCRGVRLNLARGDLLDTQLRAIVRGVPAPQRRIMLPMVIERSELENVRARLRAIETDLGISDPTPLGVMIETPAAALLAHSLAQIADFLSIGSNDLTQYALACDRGNPAVASKLDALHPAVLKLIALAVEGARAHERWLGVCGGLASDPAAAGLLIGLGVTELSVAPGQVASVKAAIREVDLAGCVTLARRALLCAGAGEVRALVREFA